MSKKESYQIPFCTKTGEMLSYDRGYDIEYKDNYTFETTMIYYGYGRGRSSATIHWVDPIGRKYSMFLSDFDDLMKDNGIECDRVKGEWTFVKKGSNFGVKLVV